MMTEKRFVYYEHKGADYILDTPNTELDFIEMLGDCLEAEEIADLLNNLNEENEQLKSELSEKDIQLDFLQSENKHMRDLVNENEQLKTVINRYEKYSNKKNDELTFRQLDILKLKEENKQLKHSIKCLEADKMELQQYIKRIQGDVE